MQSVCFVTSPGEVMSLPHRSITSPLSPAVICRTHPPLVCPRALPTGFCLRPDQAELTDEATNTITLRYMSVKILLSARFEIEYEKGIYLSIYLSIRSGPFIHIVCEEIVLNASCSTYSYLALWER